MYGEIPSVHVVNNLTKDCTGSVKKTWMNFRNYFREVFAEQSCKNFFQIMFFNMPVEKDTFCCAFSMISFTQQ